MSKVIKTVVYLYGQTQTTNTMKASKLQNQINQIAKLDMIEGELFIEIKTNAVNYAQVDEISMATLNDLTVPTGFERAENMIYRKGLRIYISFTK